MVQSMERKLCPITKVSSMLALVARLCNSHKLSHDCPEVHVHSREGPLLLMYTYASIALWKAPARRAGRLTYVTAFNVRW